MASTLNRILSHVGREAIKFTNSHMKEPRHVDYDIIREAMLKGISTYIDLELKNISPSDSEYFEIKELFLKLNPGNEFSNTDLSYKEKFLEFVIALDVIKPEEFINRPIEELKSFAAAFNMFLLSFKN
jgi:hypothetical protein